MNIQLLVIAIVSTVATVPIALFIPHQHQSPVFNRVLGVSTWFLGILGALVANNNLASNPAFSQPQLFELPIISTLIGILTGALSLHILLWGMDRFASSGNEIAEDGKEEQ